MMIDFQITIRESKVKHALVLLTIKQHAHFMIECITTDILHNNKKFWKHCSTTIRNGLISSVFLGVLWYIFRFKVTYGKQKGHYNDRTYNDVCRWTYVFCVLFLDNRMISQWSHQDCSYSYNKNALEYQYSISLHFYNTMWLLFKSRSSDSSIHMFYSFSLWKERIFQHPIISHPIRQLDNDLLRRS